MVRNFKKTSSKGNFSETQLKQALRAVKEKSFSIRKAAKEYKLDRTTLTRYVKIVPSKGKNIVEPDIKLSPGRARIFTS